MPRASEADFSVPTNNTVTFPTFIIHPFLQPKPANTLAWDVRFEPISARHSTLPNLHLTRDQLLEHATDPPMPKLHIMCGIFPAEYKWEITATNPAGVTIIDVLEAIHGCMGRQVTMDEWKELAPAQRNRISFVFDNRWRTADLPRMARDHGILRVDLLLHHILFSGLSPSPEDEESSILTLGRVLPDCGVDGQ